MSFRRLALISVSAGFLFLAGMGVAMPRAEASAIQKAPNNLGLVGYWSFEDCKAATSTDFSGKRNHGALNNFALSGATSNWQTGNAAKRGCALDFDGSNDHVSFSFPSSTSGISGDATATISAWFKTDSVSAAQSVVRIGNNAGVDAFGIFLNSAANGQVAASFNGGSSCVSAANSYRAGEWNHVVITRTPGNINATTNMYLNGAAVSLTCGSATPSIDAQENYIGKWISTFPFPFDGAIDEVRIYNRALSAADAQALYVAGQTKLKAVSNNGLVGYWSFEDCKAATSTDFSGRGNHGALKNFALSGAASNWATGNAAKRGCGLSFDGVDDYVRIATSTSLNSTTTSLTYSAWVYHTAAESDMIISNHTQTNGTPVAGVVLAAFADNTLLFQLRTGDACCQTLFSSFTIPLNIWTHVAATWDGSTMRVYKNGVLDGNTTAATGIQSFNHDTFLGMNSDNFYGGGATDNEWSGSLDEVRIYNRALSSADILALYSSGQATIRAVSNNGLLGYWSFEDCKAATSTDFSGRGNHGALKNLALSGSSSNWLTGNAAKRGCALDFDGTNDYVQLGTIATTTNVSISTWVKRTGGFATSDQERIIMGDTLNQGFGLYFQSTNRLEFGKPGSFGDQATSGAISDTEWHHVAVTYDGTDTKFYVDGVSAGTVTRSGVSYGADTYSIARAAYGGFLHGSLDDLRVYNRVLSAAEVLTLYGRR